MERGAAPNNGVAVERREAPPPSHGGGTPRKRSGRADRKACPKGVSQTPWRLPALHPLAQRGKEKGEGRARVDKNGAGGALVSALRFNQTRSDSSRLLGFDVRGLDHLAPFLGFVGKELAEPGWCQRKRCAAQLGEARNQFGIGD